MQKLKRILVLLVLAIAIAVMIPQRAVVDVSIQRGEVWNDESVIAPFDIPIYKSVSAIDSQTRQILSGFQPIFRMDTTIQKARMAELQEHMTRVGIFSRGLQDTVKKLMRYIYNKGIIPESERSANIDKTVRVSRDNMVSSILVGELFTPISALQYIGQNSKVNSETLAPYIVPNLTYDERLNNSLRLEELASISRTRGLIRTGELVIARGQMVDAETEQVLSSFKTEYENRLGAGASSYLILLGRFFIILLMLVVNYMFFNRFANQYVGKGFKELLFVMILYVMMSGAMALSVQVTGLSAYIVPLQIVAIYLLTFFNMRVAIFGNFSMALIGALFVRSPFDFFLINFAAGMIGVFTIRHYYRRNSLFRAVAFVFITQVFVFICLALIREASFMTISYRTIIWFVVNAFLMLAMYQLVYIIERIFGFVSDITLLELSDTNQPLLLKLAEKAPGTFQHSIQVANLAESAALEIGANPLLARTGALYHDIGKIDKPFYFVENFSGTYNPHSVLQPRESADIIRHHVSDGVALANKYKLPQQIIDFIENHHGTSKIYFFYAAEKLREGEVKDQEAFSYPGPRPIGKEVSICMMADSVEAASRSLKTYDKEHIDNVVDKIIDTQISERQYENSQLSFEDIARIKQLFKNKLNNIYHVRIAYPDID